MNTVDYLFYLFLKKKSYSPLKSFQGYTRHYLFFIERETIEFCELYW